MDSSGKLIKYFKLDGTLRFEIPVIEDVNFSQQIIFTPQSWAVEGTWSPDETLNLTTDQKWYTFFFPDEFFCLTVMFDSDDSFLGHAIDFVTPVSIKEDTYIITDLELDIWISAKTRKVKVLDEDEYEEMKKQGKILPELANQVSSCFQRVFDMCIDKSFPKNLLEQKFLDLFPSSLD